MSKNNFKLIVVLAILCAITVWLAVFSYQPGDNLTMVVCDVGQGDAILIIHGGNQILIDGGPGNSVLACLGRHMPFWDRNIETIVLTHPEKDHFGGLIEVVKRYKVEKFVSTSLNNSSLDYQVLKDLVGGSGVSVMSATAGMVMGDSKLYIDIVHPEQAYLASGVTITNSTEGKVLGSTTTNKNLNDFSIVTQLRFGEFDALLTGDIGPKVIDEIINQGNLEDVDIIKVPHHGSKNGLTKELLDITKPEVALISVGKNQWGHPHAEVLELLRNADIEFYSTIDYGDIVIETDGSSYKIIIN